jgi:hypothetical protein
MLKRQEHIYIPQQDILLAINWLLPFILC